MEGKSYIMDCKSPIMYFKTPFYDRHESKIMRSYGLYVPNHGRQMPRPGIGTQFFLSIEFECEYDTQHSIRTQDTQSKLRIHTQNSYSIIILSTILSSLEFFEYHTHTQYSFFRDKIILS